MKHPGSGPYTVILNFEWPSDHIEAYANMLASQPQLKQYHNLEKYLSMQWGAQIGHASVTAYWIEFPDQERLAAWLLTYS